MIVKLLLFILILNQSVAIAKERAIEVSDGNIICVYDIQDLDYLNFFSWAGKNILDGLARSEF